MICVFWQLLSVIVSVPGKFVITDQVKEIENKNTSTVDKLAYISSCKYNEYWITNPENWFLFPI